MYFKDAILIRCKIINKQVEVAKLNALCNLFVLLHCKTNRFGRIVVGQYGINTLFYGGIKNHFDPAFLSNWTFCEVINIF